MPVSIARRKSSSLDCLVEDPATKEHRPRNYLKALEERVALFESAEQTNPPTSSYHISPANSALLVGHQRVRGSTATPSEDQGSERSDLPGRLGFLDVTADQAEPQYLGSSSSFSFAHIINASLRSSVPQTTTAVGGEPDGLNPTPSPCLLPEHEVAITLSNAYFENIHPQYPFLHEPTFKRHEARLLGSPEARADTKSNYAPLFFMNMVYAIGALLLPNSRRLAEQLYASAQLYPQILSSNNLEGIQGLLCYAMYSLRSQSGPSLWKLSGLALRQCTELGYHRKVKMHILTKDRDVLQMELRKRTFWCAQGIDCAYAMRLGRPLGIQLAEVDAELPIDINDEAITKSGLQGSPRSSATEPPTSMTNAIHVIRLRRLWARMHASAYTANLLSGDSRQSYITQLREDLDQWLRDAPESLPRAGATLSIFCTKAWYEANYSGTILQLYRAQLAEDDGTTTHDVFMDCMRAASTVCRIYRRQYIGTTVKYTWATLHTIFLAGLTYLHCLWTSPAVREAVPHDEIIKTCTDCTMVLVAIAEGWGQAAPYRDIFEALASRTMSMVFGGKPEASADSQVADTGIAERDGMADWMADIDNMGMFSGFDDLLSGFMDDFTPLYDNYLAQEQE
ncbi:fungal-specific transcription factor domain-containing protein [Plectosphaerella plurivora]|uniref:Fungal-specific transcription factor domain-containing protein n=1 Tax=Plectosphaerella plurivora TaxID=936078 RepID=A0A9P9AH06_9PEZI|nr:fungal-specific transcription factor domain-containing protein [Plectosphaerella plurivora]